LENWDEKFPDFLKKDPDQIGFCRKISLISRFSDFEKSDYQGKFSDLELSCILVLGEVDSYACAT